MKIKNFLIVSFALLITLSLTIETIAQKRKASTTKKTTVSQKGTLSIEAGLVFNSGDIKPVARTQFYLLDKDLETILKDANIEPYMEFDSSQSSGIIGGIGGLSGMKAPRKAASFVKSYAVWSSFPDLYGDKFTQSQQAIKPSIVSTLTTDFSGKGVFSQVKAGKYTLVGTYRLGKQAVFWSLPIEIKAGNQSVVLDNNNATESF